MSSKAADPLLDGFHKFTDCTAAVERQALDRLTHLNSSSSGLSKSAQRADLQFALALVNHLNHLFSKRTAELRQLCSADVPADAPQTSGVERIMRVALTAFRFLHRNRAAAGFGALALEKTLANFVTACVNGHVGHRVWDAMGVLHAWLVEHAEAHVLKAAGGRAVRKAGGARGARAEGLAGGLRRLSISKPAGSPGAPAEKKEKHTPVVPTHFPMRYWQNDPAFNALVAALLCNGLRTLARGCAHALRVAQQRGAELAKRPDSALDWCVRVQAAGDESADAQLQACFRAYYALSSSSSGGGGLAGQSLDLRLLALTAYANTRACDARELLKYAARAGQGRTDSGVGGFVEGVAGQLGAQVGRAAVSPELVEFVQLLADCRRAAGDVEGAVGAWQMLARRGGEAAAAAQALLACDTLVVAAVEGASENLGGLADMLAAGRPSAAVVDAAVAARNTLAGWNALALCGDRLRRTARRALSWLPEPADSAPGHVIVACAALAQVVAADALYHAYVARGAAARAAADGGAGVSRVCAAHGDALVAGVQLAARLLEHADDAGHRQTVRRLTARLLGLCGGEGAEGVRALLRGHSTVMFNHAAVLFRLGVSARAAEAAELAADSLALWLQRSGPCEDALDALMQLCKRYEVAAAAHQAAGAHGRAAEAYARGLALLSRHVEAQELAGGARPPYAAEWADDGGVAGRALVFVDRYVRLCGAGMQRDAEDPAAARPTQRLAAGQWSEDAVVLAWLAEAEADCWRPLANTPGLAAPVQAARTGLLEHARRLYDSSGCTPGGLRCALELGKAARDLGDAAQAHGLLTLAAAGQEHALGVAAEAHGWLATADMEQGGEGGEHAGRCVALWTQLAGQSPPGDVGLAGQSPPGDVGVVRRALEAMGAFAGLLDARAVHAAERLALRRAGMRLALHCEASDARCAPLAVEWLAATARECPAAEGSRLFAQANGRCVEPEAVPALMCVAAAAAEAEAAMHAGGAGAAERAQAALDRVAEVARRASAPAQAVRGGRRAAVDAEWLAVLARVGVVQSQVAMRCGRLADAVDCGVHAHRVVAALLQALEAAEERRRRQQQMQRGTGGSLDDDDPFGPQREADEAEGDGARVVAASGGWALQRLAADCLGQLAHVHSVRGSVREAEYFARRMLVVASERLRAPRVERRARRVLADILARRGAHDECAELLGPADDGAEDSAAGLPVEGVDREAERLLAHCGPSFDALWRAADVGSAGVGGAILVPSVVAAAACAGRGAASGVRGMALAAYAALRRAAELAVSVGSPHCVHSGSRMLAMAGALALAYGSTVDAAAAAAAVAVADMLDAPGNITVAREAADALRRRMRGAPDELTAWPADVAGVRAACPRASPDTSPVLRPRQMPAMLVADDDVEAEEAEGGDGDARREAFFRQATDGARLAARWPADLENAADGGGPAAAARLADVLPAAWVVCGVSLDTARDVLLLTRYERHRTPLTLVLPLRAVALDSLGFVPPVADLQGPRSSGVFERVLGVLEAIVAASDRSMKTAAGCVTAEEKRAWWEGRALLDRAMGRLLGRVERAWLGCLRRVLVPEPLLAPGEAARDALRDCVLEHVPRSYGARARRLVLAEELCAVVLDALADGLEEEGWRDVCRMVWAVYCRRDAAPKADAQTMEAFAEALRRALGPFLLAGRRAEEPRAEAHLVLALDKHAQQLPWEVLPCLADHAVSRVASVAVLLDQLTCNPVPLSVDPTHVTYVLNPAGDLPRTQKAFEPLVSANASWRGCVGRVPSSCEFLQGLSASSVFLYFGHGGGEEYSGGGLAVRKTRVRAVALLFGCSSAAVRRAGEYDALGTPVDYAVAGCPALVGNLWDVGDKDIDRFAAEVLRQWGVVAGEIGAPVCRRVSLAQAVCAARKVCRMPFLTGAAPVVYGVPVYLSRRKSDAV
ncbi:separin protein [Coemansia interrupta]|uniref:separase n=1 Tax=Coemansia interrupta TaxID=1126814 RepID=A0A9W8LLR9_9FUNG|nr:separin protein [Coemansia interrupta]